MSRDARRHVPQPGQLATRVLASQHFLAHIVGEHGIAAAGVVALGIECAEVDRCGIVGHEH
jgi:hypothetical protein